MLLIWRKFHTAACTYIPQYPVILLSTLFKVKTFVVQFCDDSVINNKHHNYCVLYYIFYQIEVVKNRK